MTQRLPLPLTPAMLARANENEPKPRYTAEGVAEDWHGGQVGNEQDQAEPMQAVANSHSANVEDDYDPQHQEEKGEDMHQPMVPLSDLGVDYGFYGGQPYRDGDIGPRNPYPSAEVLDEPAGVAAFDTRRVPLPLTGAMLAKANANEPKPRYDTPADWSQGASGNDIDIATLTTPVVTRASADTVTPYPTRTQVAKGAAMAPPLTPLGDLGVDYGTYAGQTGRTGNVAPKAPYGADSGPGGGSYPPSDLVAWPDATNTGIPAGVTLTPHSGDLNSTADGQVIDKLHVTAGTIVINHTNVTVQRCKVDTTGSYGVRVMPGKTGATVRDCELLNAQNGIFGAGTFLRNNIYATENAVTVSGGHNTMVKDNYLHDFAQSGDPHYDGIAAQGGCNNIEVRHNRVNLNAAQTTCMFMTDEQGVADNLKCIGNYFNGGGFNILIGGALTNVVIQDNLLGIGASGFFQTTTPAGNMTFSGNVSTTGIYLDGQVPPVVGTIAFTPTVAITTGSDSNNTTGFRVGAVLAQPIATEFRVVLYTGATNSMGLDAVAFGKSTGTGQVATAALAPITFGGAAASGMPVIPTLRYVASDWMPRGALSLAAGDTMLIGFAVRNPGGTGVSTLNTNVSSYFGTVGNMANANPGYTAAANTCYGLARIETRTTP